MSELVATRLELQRVATHVLARRRCDATGKFGLRATPGGIGTPAFGPADDLEVVRISGTDLVHERGGTLTVRSIDGSTLGELAAMVGVDLTTEHDVGHDTPDLGDQDAPIAIDADVADGLAAWFGLGWRALDVVARTARDPAPAQLWPEHFDASSLVSIGPGPDDRCDVGVSPGDRFSDEPYLYVGPWTKDRPGDPAYWNADFGARRRRADVPTVAAAVAFFREGLDRFS
jgi:hypothetical protein